MKASTIHNALRLADTMAGLLRTTALTVGPPLLRYAGDEKNGRMFTGLVNEPDRVVKLEPQRAHPFGTAITYVCGSCGGPDVRIAAYAEFSEQNQKWECSATFQRDAECANCGPHIQVMPRPLSHAHT